MSRDGLTLSQQQRLTLTPEMRTTLSVLRMSQSALRDMLEAQARENPILSLAPRQSPPGPRGQSTSAFDIALETTSAPETLGGRLRDQLRLMSLEDNVHMIARAITWSLTEQGYLDGTLEDLSTELDVGLELTEQALVAVQSCEPAGVGARSLSECLALQMMERGISQDVALGAGRVLDLLVAGRFADASRRTAIAIDRLKDVVRLLPDLTPYPAQAYLQAPIVRRPDVEVRFPEAAPPEVLVLSGTPDILRLDESLLGAAKTATNEALNQYARDATALQRALFYRAETLVRIVRYLVTEQDAFFRQGPDAMRPLTRDAAAQALGLHPSTVGRAVAEKTLLYPGGTLPIAALFSARLGADTQDAVSAYGVQSRIAAMIATEDENAILSDTQIAHKLNDEGVDIARRTVAKYRGCLNIPSSYDRKRLRAASRMRGRMATSG